jgi:L-arabinokinase
VARRPAVARAEARRRLSLAGRDTVALVSFGGLGLPGFDPAVLARTAGVRFVVSGPGPAAAAVTAVDRDALGRAGLGYQDLVAAADVVITKPGYGIVSDAIAARTRLVYTDRGDFPEYPVLVAGMREWLPAEYVTNDDVREGRLARAIEAVLARPWPPPPRLDGAAVAAERLLALAS